MGDPIRIGIVGSRFAAEFHYTSYQRVTGIDVEVVGVTSLTKEHCEHFAEKRGIRVFHSFEEMLPEIDVADVCTPGYAHGEVSITASEAGKHVIIEKPLTAILYLKQVEGIAHNVRAIRPKAISARTHEITRNSRFINKGFLRTDYKGIEDYGQLHIVFDDGMIADIFASELVMGGVHNWLEIFANNHRTRCNLKMENLG
jgi:hypothetical protein